MSKEFNTDLKKICKYCSSVIESNFDLLTCPKCKSYYHIECWYQNNGCANYDCDYKIIVFQDEMLGASSIEDALINIEFLINNNRFIDAINVCRRILEIDKNNLKVKEFFNKAISRINIKMKLIESGDAALTNEDLQAAELYYSRALDYADKSESDLLRTKLYVIKEKYPKLLKRRKKSRLITNTIGGLIVIVLGFLLFYNLHLKEYIDYIQLEKGDNFDNLVLMEQQVKYYENFISKYKKGDYVEKAKGKINTFCFYIIENLYKNDWRSAILYLNMMDSIYNPIVYKDLKNKIYYIANSEVDEHIIDFNNFIESNDIESAKEILRIISEISTYFSDSDIKQKELYLQNKIDKKVKSERKLKKNTNSVELFNLN
ncbi:MAG: hypothetical protein N2490_03450 [Ignavibacteria bacterium]|nr:hypothetical protein [Ignavibacteria bacterium]